MLALYGIKVFSATLLLYAGADYYTRDGEEIRLAAIMSMGIIAIYFHLLGHALAWMVEFTSKAQKQYDRLPEKIRLIVAALKAPSWKSKGPFNRSGSISESSGDARIATTAI